MAKIDVLITAYKETQTIIKAIENIKISIENCCKEYAIMKKDFRIMICAPDKETLAKVIEYYIDKDDDSIPISLIKDEGKGKPSALNICFKEMIDTEIIILTDGDVFISNWAIQNLLKPFLENKDYKIGAVSGRPISISDKSKKYGFWSHLLSDMANKIRVECVSSRNSIVCSGYLYAFKRSALPSISKDKWIYENILSDDAFISYAIENNKYKIDYAENAQVFVKYPDNFKDWLSQKARSTGGYEQLKKMKMGPVNPMRSFTKEISGLKDVWNYGKTWKEKLWIIELIFARGMLWSRIFWERDIKDKEFKQTWIRVESTK